MKKILVIIALFAGFLNQAVAQDLLVVGEPGYRVYIDDEIKGITSDEQDGLLIKGLSLGKHVLTVKKGKDLVEEVVVDIEDGLVEHVFASSEESSATPEVEEMSFPRSDGYYLAFFMTEMHKRPFGKVTEDEVYYLLYTGADDQETKQAIEVEWLPVTRYGNEKKNVYSFEDMYYGIFRGHFIGDMQAKRKNYLLSGAIYVHDDQVNISLLTPSLAPHYLYEGAKPTYVP